MAAPAHPSPPATVRAQLVARDGSTIAVWPFTRRHIAGLQRFNASLSEATRSVFLPHAYDDATLSHYADRNARGEDRIYVACAGEDVIGYVFLWEFDHDVPVVGIGLADSWQNRGLGAPLLQLLIDDAKRAGRAAIELTTVVANERAFGLYERVGFRLVGLVDNIAGDGRVVTERRMFLALRPGAQPAPREFKAPV